MRALYLGLLLLAPLARQDPPAPQPPAADPTAEAREQAVPKEGPGRPAERAVALLVSGERAAATVRELVACGPRMGGTRSGRRAAAVRRRQFEAAGLAVQELEGPERWCHEESAWAVSAVVKVGGGETVLPLESAWPFGFSPSSSGRAPLSVDAVQEAGATLAARTPRVRGEDPVPACVLVDGSTTADGAYPKVGGLRAGDQNPYPVFGVSREEGAQLRALVAEGRAVELQWSLAAEIRRAKSVSTLARLAPREGAPPGYLLFCAHGDSDAGGPGANDNGSGEAVVLEIALAWSAAIAAGEAPRPAREVRFAIWGSEIHSTRTFLDQEMLADGPILAVINFDQSGFGSGADQLNVEPDDVPSNHPLVHVLAGVLREFEGAEFAGERGFPARWATNKSLGGTDSYVFSGSEHFRENSLPAVTVFISAWDKPERHPKTEGMPGESWSEADDVYVDYDHYYHSAGDTPQNTTDKEPFGMAWCARVSAIGAMRYLDALE